MDGIAGMVEQARGAAAHVQVGRGAYGQLCQFLPALFAGVQDKVVNAHTVCRDSLANTADRLRTAGGVYVATDTDGSRRFGGR